MRQQTDPPTIPVIELFPSGEFPEGEIQQYKDEYVSHIVSLNYINVVFGNPILILGTPFVMFWLSKVSVFIVLVLLSILQINH